MSQHKEAPSSEDRGWTLAKQRLAALIAGPFAVVGAVSAVSQLYDYWASEKYRVVWSSIALVAASICVAIAVAYLRSLRRRTASGRPATSARGWPEPVILGSTALSTMSAIAIALTFAISSTSTEDAAPPPSPSLSPPGVCAPIGQPDSQQANVVNLADVSSPISIGTVAYKIKLAYKIQLELGGEFHGSIPAGKHLFLLGQADPATHDSTPDHEPGDATYYRSNSMHVTGICWLRPSADIAYPGAEGLTFRYTLILVDESNVGEFVSDKYRNGYNDALLDTLGAERLAYFDVPTVNLVRPAASPTT